MPNTLQERRRDRLGTNVPTFYDRPIHLVRGEGVWLWDADGRRYLDAYNNVPHVGHCHPHVVEAIARQAGTLNTHTRYLHEGILDYLDRLAARLGHGIDQGIMVCSGSEANDIALRMAQAVTGHRGIIATDNTYHGNTTATAQLSTRRPPVGGYPEHVRLVPAPLDGTDTMDPAVFADHVRSAVASLQEAGHGFSGMMICPIFANEGLPAVPPGFFDEAQHVVRRAGGLLLCDEVQSGFGRCGSHFWGHDWLGISPDVVTLGKPMGNGHPVAAVLTRQDIMAEFRGAFGYFNTFGGNPVSMAAAQATLDVLEDEGLQGNARATSADLAARLSALDLPGVTRTHTRGLFFAVDLTTGDGAPDGARATRVVEHMKDKGVLIGRIGREMNILKMRPPMVFDQGHGDLALEALEQSLQETAP